MLDYRKWAYRFEQRINHPSIIDRIGKALASRKARRHGKDIFWWRGKPYYSRSFRAAETIKISMEDHRRIMNMRDHDE